MTMTTTSSHVRSHLAVKQLVSSVSPLVRNGRVFVFLAPRFRVRVSVFGFVLFRFASLWM